MGLSSDLVCFLLPLHRANPYLASGPITKLIDFPGSVFQCGVPAIQELARAQLRSILSENLPTPAILHEHFLKRQEVIELTLRVWLRKEIEALEAGASPQLSWLNGEAREIWFELTYPTPPTSMDVSGDVD